MGVEGLEGIALRYGNFYGPGTGESAWVFRRLDRLVSQAAGA
jgi:nucleoside-diphosphate-sugar epimerase